MLWLRKKRKKGGSRKTTGLGLTIAKNLTVKMGGSISASLNNNVFEIVVCFPKQKG